jgi:type II secretory pathway component PulJ
VLRTAPSAPPAPPAPRGATLVELLVALVLAAIVVGSASSTVLRQQRTAAELRGAAAGESQLRAATGALAAELSALAVASGDLVAGEARDTALELRTFVAADVACDDVVGSATFAGGSDGAPPGALAKVGDTLWWYGESDRRWRGASVTASDSVTSGCPLTGSPARPSRRVAVVTTDTIRAGAPLRVTRPARYSFYRSGDGSWQLGQREWVGAGGRFAAPQPLAGPFLIQAGVARSGFRYFDADGGELAAGSAGVDVARVARLRITVLTPAPRLHAGRDTIRRDSVDVDLQRARGP